MESAESINKRLLENYGRGIADQPLFRVVYSDSQREKRFGTFMKETEAGIYLGTETCVRDCEKYPFFLNMWILETVKPNFSNPEILEKWSYEPLWVFKDRMQNPLPLDWEIIQKICYFYIHGEPDKRTQRDLDSAEEEKIGQETEMTLDYLKNNKPFPNKMYDSAVITVPSNFTKES